ASSSGRPSTERSVPYTPGPAAQFHGTPPDGWFYERLESRHDQPGSVMGATVLSGTLTRCSPANSTTVPTTVPEGRAALTSRSATLRWTSMPSYVTSATSLAGATLARVPQALRYSA